ncbi:MAG: hypothetical protein JKY20_10955, partial [Alphaproteobacteria bacterium]|nr:hypothetical protein [Alphaproteobacteria bacterium]
MEISTTISFFKKGLTAITGKSSPSLENHQSIRSYDGVGKTIWLSRPDLREMYKDNQPLFEWWLIILGTLEYRGLAELVPDIAPAFFTDAAPESLIQTKPVLTNFMKQVWLTRLDLKKEFDLRTATGQLNFTWWYFVNGASESNLAQTFTIEQRRFLNEPDEQFQGSEPLPVTRIMAAIWRRRPDLQQTYEIDTSAGCDGFVRWYYTHGLTEYNLSAILTDEQIRQLRAPSPSWSEVPYILSLIWEVDIDVRNLYGDRLDDFLLWSRAEGQTSYAARGM